MTPLKISKIIIISLILPKKWTELTQDTILRLFRSFFWRIPDFIICFRDLLTFSMFCEVFLVKIVQIELGTECCMVRKNEFLHPAFKVLAKIWSSFWSKIRGHPKLVNKNASSKIILPNCAQSRSLSISFSTSLFKLNLPACEVRAWLYYLES